MNRFAYWPAALAFTVLILAKFDLQTGFTSLIRFGETWQGRRLSALQSLPISTIPLSSGYDGQFYAQLALDPLLLGSELPKAIDAPEYRARRILAPGIAALIGLGRAWWTLQAYALLNVACWGGLGWILYKKTQSDGWLGFARWFGCMFGMGVLDSVRQSLVDLPALLLLALAIPSLGRSPTPKSTLWLSMANLTKETSLLGVLALHGSALVRNIDRKRSVIMLVVASIPIGLWSVYVHQRLGGTAASDGLGNFSWPFLGLFAQARLCLTELLNGNFDGRYSFGLLAMGGLLTQLLVIWRTPRFDSPWWRVGAAYSLLLPFLGLWVWSGYWAACRAVLPMTIAFNLLLPGSRAFWPIWTIGNLTILHAIWRFV